LTLAKFAEDWWIPYDDSYEMLARSIDGGMINKVDLYNEFTEVMNNLNFDWTFLAKESQLLIIPEKYSNEEVKNYVKFLLQDFLFPEGKLTVEQILSLEETVEKILGSAERCNVWVNSYEVYEELRKIEQYKDLEYYNLRYISLYVPYQYNIKNSLQTGKNYFSTTGKQNKDVKIERRIIDGKDREIGDFRFTIE
jgi:hypothetical protein